MNRLRIVLVVSVILNLFLAGALVAGIISVRSGGRMINAGSLRIAGAELPRAERRPFRMALREARRSMRPALIEARAARIEAAALLRRPTIDQPAVVAALDRARSAEVAVRAAVERRAVAYAATLPPADRAKLADAMQRRAAKVRPAID
jgi:uncharacterized membrane protein